MGKFYGKIGYAITVEDPPNSGVWIDSIVEKHYYGDAQRYISNWENSGNVNDDLNINHKISIVADAFAYQNFSSIKYVEWMGVLWKVKSIEVERPRLILSIGGEYNG